MTHNKIVHSVCSVNGDLSKFILIWNQGTTSDL